MSVVPVNSIEEAFTLMDEMEIVASPSWVLGRYREHSWR